jgi:hypothetical protein
MQSIWKWIIGIAGALFLLAILSLPMLAWGFGWRGYGTMSGWGWRMPMHGGWMPMMWGGFGWMGVGVLLAGLIQLGLLVLIVLGIVWLVRAIAHQNHEGK